MNDTCTNERIALDVTADAASAPVVAPPPRRRGGNPLALKKAHYESIGSHAVALRSSLETLRLMDRLRFVRALDVAFHLYAKRTLSAALAATGHLMRRLVRDGLVSTHTSRIGAMRIYGIAQRGVNFLRDHTGHEAKAHRSLKAIRNPEHRLWANLVVIAAEARGLVGMTESEVLRYEREIGERVRGADGEEQVIPRKLLTVINRAKPGTRKGLTPDALLLYHGTERVWVEHDNSARSATRASEIRELFRSVGTQFCDGTRLARVVVHTRERRFYTHITGILKKMAQERIERASTFVVPTLTDGVFDIWYRPSIAEDRPGAPAEDFCCGRVQVAMLPDIRGKREGWYDSDWLPFAQLDEALWPPAAIRHDEDILSAP